MRKLLTIKNIAKTAIFSVIIELMRSLRIQPKYT